MSRCKRNDPGLILPSLWRLLQLLISTTQHDLTQVGVKNPRVRQKQGRVSDVTEPVKKPTATGMKVRRAKLMAEPLVIAAPFSVWLDGKTKRALEVVRLADLPPNHGHAGLCVRDVEFFSPNHHLPSHGELNWIPHDTSQHGRVDDVITIDHHAVACPGPLESRDWQGPSDEMGDWVPGPARKEDGDFLHHLVNRYDASLISEASSMG